VRQLEIKVLNIIDAWCNHEVYNYLSLERFIKVKYVVSVQFSVQPKSAAV